MHYRLAIILALLVAATTCANADETFGVPNTNNAPPTGSPVQIEDCKAGQDGGMLVATTDGSFDIAFTNEGSTTANLIRFQIDLGQDRIYIRDAGTFSPGVTVNHRFRRRGGNVVSSPLFAPAKFQCSVASVHFIDGTDWTADRAVVTNSSTNRANGWIGAKLNQKADGVYVALVLPGGPADIAGIHQGDRIASIQSNAILTTSDAVELISGAPIGTKLQISVVRNGKTLSLVAQTSQSPQ